MLVASYAFLYRYKDFFLPHLIFSGQPLSVVVAFNLHTPVCICKLRCHLINRLSSARLASYRSVPYDPGIRDSLTQPAGVSCSPYRSIEGQRQTKADRAGASSCMLTPNSFKDEPFTWRRDTVADGQGTSNNHSRAEPIAEEHPAEEAGTVGEEGGVPIGVVNGSQRSSRASSKATMSETNDENAPLLGGGGSGEGDPIPMYGDDSAFDGVTVGGNNEEQATTVRHANGAAVDCRVCRSRIDLDGRSQQHVVKCGHCQEATPIRSAPPGKKYVRCPCNCLLICKAASTRIACPRQNCRRVITIGAGQQQSHGTAMHAPTGTCRVTCAYCNEIFMSNSLTNSLATCPHCKKRSAVGASFRRSRMVSFGIVSLILFIASVVGTSIGLGSNSGAGLWWVVFAALYLGTVMAIYQFYKYASVRVSAIEAPI